MLLQRDRERDLLSDAAFRNVGVKPAACVNRAIYHTGSLNKCCRGGTIWGKLGSSVEFSRIYLCSRCVGRRSGTAQVLLLRCCSQDLSERRVCGRALARQRFAGSIEPNP